MEAKKALTEAGGNIEQAVQILRRQGAIKAAKKSGRTASQGLIEAYIHGEGRIGVLVEVNSETDFVARNQEFKNLVHDLALHVAAQNPQYVSRDEVPVGEVEGEKKIYLEEVKRSGKPADITEKIVAGKLEKFFQSVCLLEQPFVRDQDVTVQELINRKIAVIGENIKVRRFTRYVLGE